MSFVKRNRIVSIRVTEDEYQILDRISRRQGANSVSEFLRQQIVNAAPLASATRRGTRKVSEELDHLKREVARLSQIVEATHSHTEQPGRDLARKVP